MIEPLLSLAMSMHSNPGVYAVLLGSGVSRSAGIPTGWEVVQDLVRKLAIMHGEDCEPDWEAWFTSKFGQEPTYSGLLDAVAKSQAERSRLLSAYFEPTDNERERGLKVPTAAHHAIARLVKSGHVKLILTTNFDRLVEQALEAAGIAATVISSPDAIDGAMPLSHGRCTVVKLHGDYLDIRTKNTPVELQSYNKKTDKLLDRIFDEFGLIVCGWSAEWDTALRKAIQRCKGRRFTTYWTVRGELMAAAKRLIELRGAMALNIGSADEFFLQLTEKVEALAVIDRPHPLSAKVAVAEVKKYLSEPKYRIQLHDTLLQEAGRVVEEITSERYPVGKAVNEDEIIKRINDFEVLSEVLVSMMATICYWDAESRHTVTWKKTLDRLVNLPRLQQWHRVLRGLQYYPACRILYASGITAVATDRLTTLSSLWAGAVVLDVDTNAFLLQGVLERLSGDVFKVLPDYERCRLPRTERLFETLRNVLREFLPTNDAYEAAFDRYELLQSLWLVDQTGWAMPGAFAYRSLRPSMDSMLAILTKRGESPNSGEEVVKVFFGGKQTRFEQAMISVLKAAERARW